MHYFLKEEFIRDLTSYLGTYIKNFKGIQFDKKSTDAMEKDREILKELGVITQTDSTLINLTRKFSKIAICSEDEYAKGFFSYADSPDLIYHFDRLYHELYYSILILVVDGETRDTIKKIIFDFSFEVYRPLKEKCNIKLNNVIHDYNIETAYLQFKSIWTALYMSELPTNQAIKIFDRALGGEVISLDIEGVLLKINSSDTLRMKSKVADHGKYSISTEIIFPEIKEEVEDDSMMAMYYKMLAS